MEREVGGGIRMGNTCKPMAVSFQCMTKFTTNKKKKESESEKKKKSIEEEDSVSEGKCRAGWAGSAAAEELGWLSLEP